MNEGKDFLFLIGAAFVGIAAFFFVITLLAWPLEIVSCSSSTDGMPIKSHEFRYFGGCVVQLNDGSWIPLENYRAVKNNM